MCTTRAGGPSARSRRSGRILAELGLEPKEAKTRIVRLRGGRRGLRLPRLPSPLRARPHPPLPHITFLARWPSRRAMQHARDRIRELTARERLLLPVEDVVQDVNRFLRGWVGYFRYGNSARPFDKIRPLRDHAARALRGQTAPSAHAATAGGSSPTSRPNRMGLINLNGTRHRTHDPTGRGGKSRMPAVKDVGEPCAGEPHARFDGGREETNASRPRRTAPGASRLPDRYSAPDCGLPRAMRR